MARAAAYLNARRFGVSHDDFFICEHRRPVIFWYKSPVHFGAKLQDGGNGYKYLRQRSMRRQGMSFA
ncbi:hypothetical protein NDU88_000854 [Pleurodeles waltl]|uniref:Uncharacterized protein n=1 Tax=Pleurodeles waltl TaxID=8319 RepID=A0AAV7U7K9_PLEWA|nr:hypothetical protein NDU88_000854 [Pleurodeles waltl]